MVCWRPVAFLSLFLLIVGTAFASDRQPAVDWHGSSWRTLRQYEKIHKQYVRQSCRRGQDHKYYRLLKKYRASQYYIPEAPKGSVDFEAIATGLKMLKKKYNWIGSIRKDLWKSKSYPNFRVIASPLKQSVSLLLKLKKEYRFEKNAEKRAKLKSRSQAALAHLKEQFHVFTKKIPFLLSFEHPVDHFANRSSYSKFKSGGRQPNRKLANKVFFKRRTLEDGAMEPNHTRSDKFLRSTLDTLALRMPWEKDFLSENTRYDLDWIFKRVARDLQRGRRRHLSRLKEWRLRTKKAIDFYSGVLAKKNHKKILKQKVESSKALKTYVLKQHAKSYAFWSRQPEIYRSLFVLDQILFNEMDAFDHKSIPDRRDVAQVVLNRHVHPFYQTLGSESSVYEYLPKKMRNSTERNKWLNVLFKEGEFSFTYYFISSVVRVFCPDQSHRGKKIRTDNLKLAIKVLRHPNYDFRALRYFSRKSMFGRIDMTQIWSNYQRIAERPGFPIKTTRKRLKQIKKKNFRYLYGFEAPDGENYDVVEIDNEVYTVSGTETKWPRLYNYRNPHSFTFFEPMSTVGQN